MDLKACNSSAKDWRLLTVENGLRVFSYAPTVGVYKASVIVGLGPEKVSEILRDSKQEYEVALTQTYRLTKPEQVSSYLAYQSPNWWSWPRDYCVVEAVATEGKTSYVARQSNDDPFCPPQSGFVRAIAKELFILEAIPNGSTFVTLITANVFAGWVPSAWTHALHLNRFKCLAALKDYIQNSAQFVNEVVCPSKSAAQAGPPRRGSGSASIVPASPAVRHKDAVAQAVVSSPAAVASTAPADSELDDTSSVQDPSDAPTDEPLPLADIEKDTAELLDPGKNRYKDDIYACRKRLFDIVDDITGWTIEKTVAGVMISTKKLPGSTEGQMTVRGEKILPFPALALQDGLKEVERKKEYDPMIVTAKLLEEVDACTGVTYECYQTVWPVASRDSVYIGYQGRFAKRFYSIGVSTDHPKAPVVKGNVRLKLFTGGWVMEPNPEDVSKTRVIYIASIDLGGSIPNFAKQRVITEQPMVVERLAKFLAGKEMGAYVAKHKEHLEALDQVSKQREELKRRQLEAKQKPRPQLAASPKQQPIQSPAPNQPAVPEGALDSGSYSVIMDDPLMSGSSSLSSSTVGSSEDEGLLCPSPRSSLDLTQSGFSLPSSPFLATAVEQRAAVIGPYPLPFPENKYKDMMKDSVTNMLATMHSINKQESWKSINKKLDVYIFHRNTPDTSIKCQIGTGIVNLPPAKIVAAIMDVNRQKEWDPLFKSARIVEEVDTQTTIIHFVFETRMCVFKQARDFCFVRFIRLEKDGTYIIAARSCVHPDCPETSEMLRGDIIGSGWVIKPRTNDPHSSVCTYITQVDLKGVPSSLMNIVQDRQPLNVAGLRAALTGSKILPPQTSK